MMDEKNPAEQEFERWRELRDPQLKRESFVTAWAKVAWLAEGRMHAMGRDLAKLQYRIGRQRKANRELREALRGSLGRETKLEDDIENLKQQVVRAEENARQWEGNEIAQHERVKELEREAAMRSEDSCGPAHWLRDAGFGTTDADSDERRTL